MDGTIRKSILAGSLLGMLMSVLLSETHARADDGDLWAYVGTYSRDQESEGIYVFRFDPQSGQAGPVKLAAPSDNPSFLAIHPDGRHLYAVNEIDDFGGERSGAAHR